ncbi:MAG: transporter, partial [Haloferacaceae archaeon]
LLGYLVTYVTQQGVVEQRLRGFNAIAQLFGADPIPVWKAIGWLFYNAHLVETRIPGFGGPRTVNFIADAQAGSVPVLYLLPPVVLLGAGAVVALIAGMDAPGVGAGAGALVALGYLPLALVGALVVGYHVGDGQVAPDLVTAVALAGVLYPAVFGGGGGALVGAFSDRGS